MWREYSVAEDDPHLECSETLKTCGCAMTDEQCIYISDKLKGIDLEVTRLHERLHAIWYSYMGVTEESNEELIVTALAAGLIQSGYDVAE